MSISRRNVTRSGKQLFCINDQASVVLNFMIFFPSLFSGCFLNEDMGVVMGSICHIRVNYLQGLSG